MLRCLWGEEAREHQSLQLFLYLPCPYHTCGGQASLGPQESPMSVSVGCVTGESQSVRMGCTETCFGVFVSSKIIISSVDIDCGHQVS